MIGLDGLVKNLRTNLEKGLTPNDLEDRVRQFGTNRKDPPERTPYWQFFLKAIDDFMLKLLLVCAVVNIGFEVGFAAPKDRSHGK
jgi:magnesium-transporting ATPase (P-type)